jgi:glycosyltransferase involved in cell wall biosynthesis
MKPFLTIFIPAYNEEECLQHNVEAVLTEIDKMGVPTEVLIVDDASQDHTWQIAEDLAARIPGVHALHHPKNLGIGGAFVTAVGSAQGEWMILIPADLALEPRELHRYIEAAPQADVVIGLRSDRSDYTLARRIISWTNIYLIQRFFGMRERQFQYISMYRLEVLQQIEIEYWRSAFFLAEILIKAKALGYRLVQVEILYTPRLTGRPTGAKLALVVRTVFDIIHFWLRWVRMGKAAARPRTCAEHSRSL